MRDPIIVGGHLRIRPFNTADSYPEQRLDNDLCQAVVAGHTVYLRGQVPQDLNTGASVHIGNPAAQAEQVMTNVETLLGIAVSGVERPDPQVTADDDRVLHLRTASATSEYLATRSSGPLKS